jgi:probable selenium-dependent hydroxylase accessory protein YqeC
LAAQHPGRVGVTTTVQLPPFPRSLPGARVIEPAATLVEQVTLAARENRVVAFAHPSEKYHRVAGVAPQLLAAIQAQAGFDLLLVKADGARQKPLKAPAPYEPVIPPQADTVLILLSVGVIGAPLDDTIAHRVELITEITGAQPGERLQPQHLVRLLVSPDGYLKGVGNAGVIPIINQVDDGERHRLAAELAHAALARTDRFDRIVLTAMRQSQPVVDIIER